MASPKGHSALPVIDEAQMVAGRTKDFAVAQLREVYPYMKTKTLEDIANACEHILKSKIESQMPEMCAAQDRISFLSLSAELRNRIYELVVCPTEEGEGGEGGDLGIRIGWHWVFEASEIEFTDGTLVGDWEVQPAITKVCRQIRQETLAVYYGLNKFVTYEVNEDVYDRAQTPPRKTGVECSFPRAMAWLEHIGQKNAQLLKHVRVKSQRDHYVGEDHLDPYPATRFREQAKRLGILLPPGSVVGIAWDTYSWRRTADEVVIDETDAEEMEDPYMLETASDGA